MIRVALHFLAAAIAAGTAGAQLPDSLALPSSSPAVSASGENSRLRQTENLYQQQLSARHIPLLGQYLTNLQRLAAQAADPLPYQQEIERVQAIISGGGVVDLAAAAQSLNSAAQVPVPTPAPPPSRVPRTIIALTPGLARSISPLPSGSSSPSVASIGEIEWRIESLPAGTYDLVIQYSLAAADAPLATLVEFAGQRLENKLDANNATTSGATFRLLRLGHVTLPKEIHGEVLRLQAGDKESTALQIRQVVITRTRASD